MMTPREEISRLLAESIELGKREGRAIKGADWKLVSDLARQREQLRERLSLAKVRFLACNSEPLQTAFPIEMGRLISLANRNAALLTRMMEVARDLMAAAEQTHRNLRKLHNSYALRPNSVAWDSYS